MLVTLISCLQIITHVLEFDKTIDLTLKFLSLELFMRSLDYQLLMKIVSDNISFDDIKEEAIGVEVLEPGAKSSTSLKRSHSLTTE